MSAVAIFGGIGISLAALGWLATRDPKRRRAFGLPARPAGGPGRLAWSIALLPGLMLPWLSGGPGFVLWLGSVSVAGWALVAVPPGRAGVLGARFEAALGGTSARFAGLGRRVSRGVARLGTRPPRWRSNAAPPEFELALRVADLEGKVRQLEAELARLRDGARPPGEALGARVA